MAYPVVSLASLLIQESKEKIYAAAIRVAAVIGVPTDSWQPGDPTRSLFWLEAETLSKQEESSAGYISSNFLDYAHGVWLKIGAKQRFNVDVPPATYATTDVVLSNAGGGRYPDNDPGDLTFRNSTTDKTYHSVTGGTLEVGPGATLTITVEADEPGSDSSAGPGEIDELINGWIGVTCTNPTAAVGADEQDESTTVQQCKDKTDAISDMGAAGAYRYWARRSDITGTNGITRVRAYGDNDAGDVTVVLAGPSGGVSEPDRVAVDAVLRDRALPLCVTLHTVAASNVSVPVTYELWVYQDVNKTADQVKADVTTALATMFAARDIGGDRPEPPATSGALYKSLIESTIRGVYPQAFRVIVTSPAGDTTLTNTQVATLGAGAPSTVHLVPR